MRIKFDSRQTYQLDAIGAICDLFRGQPKASTISATSLATMPGELFGELGVGNRLAVSESQIYENLLDIQQRNGIPETNPVEGMNFSVEMETGTGKTYVYLRTVYELNSRFGFKKFVIVVPSVAIREGVQKSIDLTREHFADLYGRVPCETWTYDSTRLSTLRQFAASNQLQMLIVNIDAFNKTANIIHKEQESGRKPIEFIQTCRPIVIIDEPQNMESDLARQAIDTLSPICTLRYSATHRNLYNLTYRLDPVRAYDLRLVKRIEVDSVLDEADFNKPFVKVEGITAHQSKIVALLTIDVRARSGPIRKKVKVSRNGIDLYDLSGERETYRGYIVDHIDASSGYVAFTNGIILSRGEAQGGSHDDIMRAQIRETVREHLEKELTVHRKLSAGTRVKVLSLFFIDRVANYVPVDGKIRRWFLEAYGEFSEMPRYKELKLPAADAVHGGYFAETKGLARDTAGTTADDDKVYALIMREKERLLSADEPLRFIFSHSALREGWDNPNVFQICTLNESKSEIKKRQEIGRGLRLPVNESGERCFDVAINKLTVVANESYEQFARELQTEIETDCGVSFQGRIANKRERKLVRLKKGWRLTADFIALWDRIKHRTRYSVVYSTADLIGKAVVALAGMPSVARPKIVTRKADLSIDNQGVVGNLVSIRDTKTESTLSALPDVLGYLQRETELTRGTLAQILIDSGRLDDLLLNPQEFLDRSVKAIHGVMQDLTVAGIKYERIAGAEYEMYLFEQNEIEGYLSRMLKVSKSIYDAVEFESEVERRFAEELDARADIKFFVKLPNWFKVGTPLGTYTPDWAIVKEKEAKIYLVRETKSTIEELRLRGIEWRKIQCGKAHFDELGVDFKAVTSAREV